MTESHTHSDAGIFSNLPLTTALVKPRDDIFHFISTTKLFKGICLRDEGHCRAKEDLETTQQSHIATRKFETEGKL